MLAIQTNPIQNFNLYILSTKMFDDCVDKIQVKPIAEKKSATGSQ